MQAQGVINFVWNKTFDIFVLTEQKILIFVQHHDLTFPPFLLEEKPIVYTQPLNLLRQVWSLLTYQIDFRILFSNCAPLSLHGANRKTTFSSQLFLRGHS